MSAGSPAKAGEGEGGAGAKVEGELSEIKGLLAAFLASPDKARGGAGSSAAADGPGSGAANGVGGLAAWRP